LKTAEKHRDPIGNCLDPLDVHPRVKSHQQDIRG
jgi:hypothetical protein